MKPGIFLSFILLIHLACLNAEENLYPMEGKVAVLSAYDVADYPKLQEKREELWVDSALRLCRGLYRTLGLSLDGEHEFWLKKGSLIGWLGGVMMLWVALRFGKKQKWILKISLASFPFFLIYGFTAHWIDEKVRELEAFDQQDYISAVEAVDLCMSKGIAFDRFHRWSDFEKAWARGLRDSKVPYVALLWAGKPQGLTDQRQFSWLESHKDKGLVHVGLGIHLPKPFSLEVFGAVPLVDFSKEYGQSLTEKKSYYGRRLEFKFAENHSPLFSGGVWGKGRILYLKTGLEPSLFQQYGLSQLRLQSRAPFATASLEGLAALRCDDPGSAQGAYLKNWIYPPLQTQQWKEVDQILTRHQAQMTIGYCTGWVDDGEASRGELKVDGQSLSNREAGKVYPSWKVHYSKLPEGTVYDQVQQYQYFLKESPNLDFELHGYTHITSDRQAWLTSGDQYENPHWYREFRGSKEDQEKILNPALIAYEQAFDEKPSTLIPPGHVSNLETLKALNQTPITMLSDGGLVLKHQIGWLRSTSIRGVDWFDTGALKNYIPSNPIVLVGHDYDFQKSEIKAFDGHLKQWKQAGVQRFITLRELNLRMRCIPTVLSSSKDLELQLNLNEEEVKNMKRCMKSGFDFWINSSKELEVIPDSGLKVLRKDLEYKRILLRWSLEPKVGMNSLRVAYSL